MVTDQAPDHDDQFEELAAGYALDALEPTDEQTFLRHAQDCPDCTRMVASYREVAAAIASVVPPPANPSPQLADRIMATVRAGQNPSQAAAPTGTDATSAGPPGPVAATPGQPDAASGTPAQPDASPDAPAQPDAPAEVVPLRPRRRWLRPATAAAAVALIAGGGIWAGLAASSGNSAPTVANCQVQHGCFETALSSLTTHELTAKVLVQDGKVWMVPTNMKADNTAHQIYVLWQLVGKHAPVALGGFDVHSGGSGTEIEIGKLASPYQGTSAFAISLEPGRTVPAAPTKVVSAGTVP